MLQYEDSLFRVSHRGGDVYRCCSISYGTKRNQALRRADDCKLQINGWKIVIEWQLNY